MCKIKTCAQGARRLPGANRPNIDASGVAFMPALTPMEAAVLPARQARRPYGALAMVPRACDAPYRAKIWVR